MASLDHQSLPPTNLSREDGFPRKCHSFTINESNKFVSRVDEELPCPAHEEEDTNLVYHACNINYPAEIVIRSIDTDIAAIMLGNMHPRKSDSVVWMLTGTRNNLRYVDLTKIHAELGQLICQSLPGYHAITGCDFNRTHSSEKEN
ncbi:uncharacterized protein TNCV_3727271 [Trichonephila clavipes]|uniref:Uncharacterized protein n=1 Tax=Trichonephila clavipes TaxID=2585209 RepID=A0A8X6USX7_TRICX|nr:uncharacterized protein TNCV_3727271 [Trichonephila clavipes]